MGVNTGAGGTTVGETTGLSVNAAPPVVKDIRNKDNQLCRVTVVRGLYNSADVKVYLCSLCLRCSEVG